MIRPAVTQIVSASRYTLASVIDRLGRPLYGYQEGQYYHFGVIWPFHQMEREAITLAQEEHSGLQC